MSIRALPAFVLLVVLSTSCSVPGTVSQPDRVPSTELSSTQPPVVVPSSEPAAATPADLGAAWEHRLRADIASAMASSMSGSIGLAVAPAGTDSVATFGTWTEGSAWSTIKVPLVLASMAHPDTYPNAAASAAITLSDNASAEQVWYSLGDDAQAAGEVGSILAAAGDAVTTVPDTRIRSSYSIFGQTQWSLHQQTVFGSHLPCLQDGPRIRELMGSISPSQSWGLGRLDSAEFKGGWGPDAVSGGYLVRQFGVLTGPSGLTAVSIAAEPDSGSFEDGIAMLDAVAGVLDTHRAELPGGACVDAPVSAITTEWRESP